MCDGRSFFCMTTNLTRGEPTVHTEGLLWKLVRASMTIVGLVPPVTECGELLIDGGYLNNMPVDVMRGLGVDTVRPHGVVVDTYSTCFFWTGSCILYLQAIESKYILGAGTGCYLFKHTDLCRRCFYTLLDTAAHVLEVRLAALSSAKRQSGKSLTDITCS